jgi:hypothetical protein
MGKPTVTKLCAASRWKVWWRSWAQSSERAEFLSIIPFREQCSENKQIVPFCRINSLQ